MWSFSLSLPDFLLSVSATSLGDAKIDSQVQWKQTIHSTKFKSFYSSCATKLEIQPSDCGVRRAFGSRKMAIENEFNTLFVRHKCSSSVCLSKDRHFDALGGA